MNLLAAVTVVLIALAATPYVTYVALYSWLQPSGTPADKRDAEPAVSVVLPSYNESSIIERKLDDVVSLDYPMEKVEVVVVDSSDDETPTIVEEYFETRDHPELTLIRETDRRGVASAVNRGVEAATGSVVFRTDCDSKLNAAVVREAVATLADDDVGAVTGRQVEVLGGSAVESEYRDLLTRLQAVESHLDSTFIAHGPCFAFERDAFVPLPSDTVADDTEIAVGVRQGGKRVVMDPAMRFSESGVSAFTRRRTRKDRRALGLVQTLVRNRDMLGGYGWYGRIVLPFNWWFMVFSPWLTVLAVLVATTMALSMIGIAGLALPALVTTTFWLGQRDQLGPVQPLHAVMDAQVSLLVAGVQFVRGRATGTWEIDRRSRDVFE